MQSEKTGVDANVISLPKGGGAMQGMGETFSADLFSGTGNYSIPIAVPKGRMGMQPQLSLGYSTGNGNGTAGLGWNMSLPGIMRKTSLGIPQYQDEADIFVLSGAEDLIPISKETEDDNGVDLQKTGYKPRTEGLFAHITHITGSDGRDYWQVQTKDGKTSFYGNPAVVDENPCIVSDPEKPTHIFQWLIFKTIDLLGNEVVYEYDYAANPNDKNPFTQIYLKEIKYADFVNQSVTKYLCSVLVNYEDRPDIQSSFNSGFEIKTEKRIANIETYTHPLDADLPTGYTAEVGGNNILVKRTVLTYQDETPAGAPENGVSLLVNVQVEGHGPDGMEAMPPVEFTYSEFDGDSRDLMVINGKHLPATSLANPNMSLVDLDGNGLPDMVEMAPGQPIRYWKNKGKGQFDLPRQMKDAPLGMGLEAGAAQLMDADGDGRADLVINTPTIQGYYSLRNDGQWDTKSYTRYETVPTVNFASADVKFMDLTGDGRTDAIINGDKSLVCYFQNSPLLSEVGDNSDSAEKPGWSDSRRIRKQDADNFPNVNFSDPRIRVSDLSGDGLSDIVMITNGGVFYWPNLGYGKFGKKRQMKNAPRPGFNFDPNRVILADINGDGLTDYLYINTNSVDYWINQSGKAWDEMKTVKGTPRFTSRDSIQVVDLMGTGTPGLLWSYDLGANRDRFYFVDLTHGVKPYLLNEVNNNLGAITKVEYTPSTYFYLRDLNGTEGSEFSFVDPVGEWKTRLPFPVLTVSKVEAIDKISKTKLTSRYFYHHGYWDGVEREFRGFGRVDQFDTETFEAYNANGLLLDENFDGVLLADYSPPIYTKNWFHLGPVQKNDGDWGEVEYLDEYWEGDAPMLNRPDDFYSLVSGLSRRAKRDAFRTLRGTALRSELFAKDGSDLRQLPYSVKETQNSIKLIDSPDTNLTIDAYRTLRHSNHIYFPFQYAARETMWERGAEPKTSFSFTGEIDDYGQVLTSLSIAVPRGKDPLTGGQISGAPNYDANHTYASVLNTTEYFIPGLSAPYFVDRVLQSKSEEITGTSALSVFEIRSGALDETLTTNLLGHQLNYYDGAQFVGEAYGAMGLYGLLVKSEVLAVTPAELTAAYGVNIPPAFAGAGTPDWSAYPTAFVNELNDTHLGYTYYDGGGATPHLQGYYATGDKLKYDIQDSGTTINRGLVMAMRDAYDHETEIEYDTYHLLPEKVTDPVGMEVSSENDYRLLAPVAMTDPNGNISKVAYNPLGLVEKTALCGKDDGSEGDTLTTPGASFEYDFFAYMNEGDPISVKKTVREHHINADYLSSLPTAEQSATIQSAEYSDGYGRIIQSRTQAEDIIYGDAKFGDSGLSTDMTQKYEHMSGVERSSQAPLNVVVSGHKRYNNKGEVVEQYEPYFDSDFDYAEEDTPTGATIKMYYDALGRMVKTKNPDNSEQRILFGIPNALNTPDDCLPTPWERYTYDANDLAPLTHPTGDNGGVLASHHYTPKSELIDVLGRVVQTTEHAVFDPSGNYDGTTTYEDVVMKYEYDIKGQLTKSIDPYLRIISENKYDTAGNMLYSEHIDRGAQTICMDVLGLPVLTTDAKGAETLSTYDDLNRPIKMRAKDKTSEAFTLRVENTYGDSAGLTNPENLNLKGALYKQYDSPGMLLLAEFDFKGNLLEKSRQVIKDSLLTQKVKFTTDWDTLTDTDLDGKKYETSIEYDGLNRPRKIKNPLDQDSERKETIPTYNRAGALQKLNFDGEDYVKEVAYNAKGQKIMTASGDVYTRYLYDTETFRLLRIRNSKYTKSGNTYTTINGIRLDRGYAYDLMGSVVKEYQYTPNNTWARGAGNLTRNFTHDPMRRLLSGTGREYKNRLQQPTWDLNYRPDNYQLTNVYTRSYEYDKIGNIQNLKHVAHGNTGANFNRNYAYESPFSHNQLKTMTISTTDYTYRHDANGNQVTENSERHYEWNHADKLAFYKNQVGTSDPTKWSHYLYDGEGNRIKKVVNTGSGKQTVTVYIDGVFEHSYTKNNGTIDSTRHYNTLKIMDGSSLVATLHVGNDADDTINIDKKFYTADHLGNICVTYQETSTIINFEDFYPFGETAYGGYAKKRYRYNGKEKDSDTGLYEYGQRYYAPWLCRFVSVDPIAEDFPQLSSYNYASNRPETARDIEGLQAEGQPTGESGGGNNHTNSSSAPENSTSKIDNLEDLPNTLPLFEVTETAPWHSGVTWTKELKNGARQGQLDIGGLKILGTDYGIYGSDFKYLKEGLSTGKFSEEEFFAAAMSHALEEKTDSYTINQFRNEQVLRQRAVQEAFGNLMEMFTPPNPEDYDNPVEYAVFMAIFMIDSIDPIPEGGGSSKKSNRQLVKEKKLPIQGMIRFIPRKTDLNIGRIKEVKKGKDKGYMDKFGNRWFQGPTRTKGEVFEWDVELSEAGLSQLKDWVKKGKSHINVSLKGRITH